jgi:hypothetical protein
VVKAHECGNRRTQGGAQHPLADEAKRAPAVAIVRRGVKPTAKAQYQTKCLLSNGGVWCQTILFKYRHLCSNDRTEWVDVQVERKAEPHPSQYIRSKVPATALPVRATTPPPTPGATTSAAAGGMPDM